MQTSTLRSKQGNVASFGFLTALLAFCLAGCALISFVPAGTYDVVDRAADELNLEDAGEIIYGGHFGGAINTPGPHPTSVMVIEGDDAANFVAAELRDAGFNTNGDDGDETFWKRDRDDEYVGVIVTRLAAGDSPKAGQNDTKVTVKGPAVRIQMYNV